MRIVLPSLTLLLLAACTPPVPDSRADSVGFESYGEYQRRRIAEQQARGAQPVQTVQGPVQNPIVPFPATSAPNAAELAAAGVGGAAVTGASAPAPTSAPIPTSAPPPPPTPAAAAVATHAPASNRTGISDEQDFSAVSARETIESDRARMEANRAKYQQIQPTELPQRSRASGPDIIDYAINAPNRLGEAIYSRSSIKLSRTDRACARFATPEEAQQAFLKSGGPRRDPRNLDPDGDGYACYWDPTPFQKVRG